MVALTRGVCRSTQCIPGWSGLDGVCVLHVWNRAMRGACLVHVVLILPRIALTQVSMGVLLQTMFSEGIYLL